MQTNVRCTHVIQGFTNYSAWANHLISAAIVCIILSISDRKTPFFPKSLSPFKLMSNDVLSHSRQHVFIHLCVWENLPHCRILVSVKGRLICSQSHHLPRLSVFLLLIAASLRDLTFSLKSPSLCYHSTRGSQKELWYWKQAWHERRGFRGM